MAKKPVVRRLKLRKKRGSVFPGEIAGYSDPLAQQLIDAGIAFEVDEDGRPVAQAPVADEPAAESQGEQHKFNETTDPFITDGLSKTASKALHAAGIDTVDQLKAFMQIEGDLSAIEDLTDAQIEKIRDLYS